MKKRKSVFHFLRLCLTTFEHQVQDFSGSQKVQVFSSLRMSETHFRHQQGYQRASVLKGFITDT